MEENFKVISHALAKAGLKHTSENKTGKPVDFKITPYSLNTSLSFRFGSAEELIKFIDISGVATHNKSLLESALVELGLNPKEFFYVNFFEHGKEAEM